MSGLFRACSKLVPVRLPHEMEVFSFSGGCFRLVPGRQPHEMEDSSFSGGGFKTCSSLATPPD